MGRSRYAPAVHGDGDGAAAPDFDTLMTQLEAVVRRLESDDVPLEEALEMYERGVRLHREGHERLATMERRIEELSGRGERVPLALEEAGE